MYHQREKRNAECCLVEVDLYLCGSIWFGLESQRTDSSVENDWNLISQRYKDDIIGPVLIPPIQVNEMIFVSINTDS